MNADGKKKFGWGKAAAALAGTVVAVLPLGRQLYQAERRQAALRDWQRSREDLRRQTDEARITGCCGGKTSTSSKAADR
jgi:hypothetical protein